MHRIVVIKAPVVIMIVLSMTACASLGILCTAAQEFEKGVGMFNQGRYTEAIPHFQRATDLDPDFARAYLYLGRCHVSLQQWPEAIPPLRTALRLSPDEFKEEVVEILLDALLGMAMAQFQHGNLSDAFAALEQALTLDPQSQKLRQQIADLMVSSGQRYSTEGHVDDAITIFLKAVELSPDDPAPYVNLAKALIAKGNFKGALRALFRALNLDPDDPQSQQLLKALTR